MFYIIVILQISENVILPLIS